MYSPIGATAILENNILYFKNGNKRDLTINDLLKYSFKLIEDEIDIQSIELFRSEYTMNNVEFQIRDKINQILLAVKQLDRKIREER